MATTYFDLTEAVAQYYGRGSEQYIELIKGTINPDVIRQVPGVTIFESNSGKFLGYDYVNPFETVNNTASNINSNIPNSVYGDTFSANIPASAVTDSTTGTSSMTAGAKVASTGSTLATVADKVSLGVAGVALGTKLGKLIDSTIYNANPDFWDETFPSINPETWDDIASTDLGKGVIRGIFGLQGDGQNANTTMYLDERMLATMYMLYLTTLGDTEFDVPVNPVLSVGDDIVTFNANANYFSFMSYAKDYLTQYHTLHGEYWGNELATFDTCVQDFFNKMQRYNDRTWLPLYYVCLTYDRNQPALQIGCAYVYGTSSTPINVTSVNSTNNYIQYGITHNGSVWVYRVPYRNGVALNEIQNGLSGNIYQMFNPQTTFQTSNSTNYRVLWNIGDWTIHGVNGISNDDNANTQINPSNIINPTTNQPVTPNDNINDVINALRTAYPSLFDGEIYEDVPQEDGTVTRIKYIPTPIPTFDVDGNPITGTNTQNNPSVNPTTNTDEQLQHLTDTLTDPQSTFDGSTPTPPTDVTPPNTGSGDTPVAVLPDGSASSLWKVYNPTQSEVDSFGSWLWSSNLVEQIKKLFNDPMQAIIGIHKVFATPVTGGITTIKCGYIDSGVSSKYVTNQYTTINCGSINLREYFGNVFDYAPYTEINIFLPFIGIVKLDTADVMRGTISVNYSVDVITGACLAEISIERDGSGGVIYTYSGSAIVSYPLSSGSYMSAVGGVLSIAGGVIGTIASGGSLAPMALGALSGATHLHTNVYKSGNFSGSAGAMGIKKPYLIISRPQTAMANNFQHYTGYPANSLVTLSSCYGHTRVKALHVENIPSATDKEKSMIESILKNGVVI